MRPRPAARVGFTLVELLVVIGIIALLIAVLMPALSGARAQASRLVCATNVRTLAQVALQYAHDNKGWIPRNYAHNDPPFPSWVDLLVRSMKRNLPTPPVNGAYTQAYDTAAGPFYAATPWLQCPVFPTEAQGVDYVINGWLIEMQVGLMPEFGLLYDPELKGLNAETIYDRIVNDLRMFRKSHSLTEKLYRHWTTFRGKGMGDMLDGEHPEWWTTGAGTTLDDFYRRA